MKNNWKEVKLGDVCNITRGASPRPIHDYLSAYGLPWIKISDATDDSSRFINKTKEFIKEEGRSKTRWLQKGAFILSNSATPGIPKILKIDACVHDGWLIFNFDNKIIDKWFLYYLCLILRTSLVGLADGTVFRNLKTDIVKNFPISLPPLEEQKRIADILSSFDDKVELLQKQNKTLEDMAKAIFKSWFVDFDIVKAKERREKKSKILNEYKITEEIYNLFPDSFEDSELGKIPKGWEMKPTNALLEFNIGGGWGNDENTNDFKMPAFVIRGTDIPKIKLSGNISDVPYRYHKESNFNSRKLINGDIILETAGGSKGQPVGRALLITPYIIQSLQNAICASFCKLLRVNNTIYSSNIFYYFLELMYETLEIEQYQVQSTGISNFQFEYFLTNKFFVVPNTKIINFFDAIITDINNKMDNNKYQTKTLTGLRDALLPKLISGEIEV